jgi:alanyl-tRNA synthetase
MFQNKSNTLGKIQVQMNCKEEELPERVGQLFSEKKILEKKIKELIQTNDSDVDSWIKNSQKIGEYSFVIELINISDVDHLKRSGDKLLSQIDSGVGVLFSSDAHKPSAVIVLTDNLIKQGLDAGNLAKEIGSFMGGGGGGKPHLATAGGRDQAQVQNAIEKTRNLILNKLNT